LIIDFNADYACIVKQFLESEDQALNAAKDAFYTSDKLFDNAFAHINYLDESISRA